MEACPKHYDLPGYLANKPCPYCEPAEAPSHRQEAKSPPSFSEAARLDGGWPSGSLKWITSGEEKVFEVRPFIHDSFTVEAGIEDVKNFVEQMQKHTHVTNYNYPESERPHSPTSPPRLNVQCPTCGESPFEHIDYGYGCVPCTKWLEPEQVWRRWEKGMPEGNYWTSNHLGLAVIPTDGLGNGMEEGEWVMGPIPEPKAPR